ncbi:hypothetical protein PSP6_80037 [Paraburkholderia tropica]|nr:hypothetical protein PSP6_80037 [Paraburkholderia tropica]
MGRNIRHYEPLSGNANAIKRIRLTFEDANISQSYGILQAFPVGRVPRLEGSNCHERLL